MWAAIRGIPTTAWVCALVAILNSVCWSILIPPLQGPDEQAHFAYVQQLVENGKMPNGSSEENFSPEELAAMNDLGFGEVILNPGTPSVPSRADHAKLIQDLSQPRLSRKGDGSVGVAASEPPLYYALQTVPYVLGSGGTLLTRLELMRLLSALLSGLTVLFVFLFIREALPAVPWAWTVGALSAALSPLLGFVGGSLDPDALLFAVCAALFYCLARAFRRGFDRRMAGALGGVVAIGFLTKVNFVALVAGVALGMILLTIREARSSSRREAYRSLALAAGIAISPGVLYILINLTEHKELLGIVSGSIQTTERHNIPNELAYIWQFYLPRLPGMPHDFPGIFPPWHVWFKGAIARYNWLETSFPGWVYKLALIPATAIAGLCARELYLKRRLLRRRAGEFTVYLTMLVGLMVLLAAASFDSFPTLALGDSEPRYFLPMLALGGTLLALAARGAGKRWGPVAGAGIVMLILGHDVLSQMLEVSRYYHPW
jgi:4-amino-4-deoxy-L-arabinose transferase-like glycosyltransferase